MHGLYGCYNEPCSKVKCPKLHAVIMVVWAVEPPLTQPAPLTPRQTSAHRETSITSLGPPHFWGLIWVTVAKLHRLLQDQGSRTRLKPPKFLVNYGSVGTPSPLMSAMRPAYVFTLRGDTDIWTTPRDAAPTWLLLEAGGQQQRLMPDGNAGRNPITASNHLSSLGPFFYIFPSFIRRSGDSHNTLFTKGSVTPQRAPLKAKEPIC